MEQLELNNQYINVNECVERCSIVENRRRKSDNIIGATFLPATNVTEGDGNLTSICWCYSGPNEIVRRKSCFLNSKNLYVQELKNWCFFV